MWLAKLEKLEPDTFRTVGLKARVLAKLGQGQNAVASIQALVKADDTLLAPAAALLERIGQPLARAMYESLLPGQAPEGYVDLATFFGRQNLPEKALAVCERAWPNCPPEAVGSAAMTVLYTSKATAEQHQRVAG